jgi:uncharacterized protein
MYPRLLAARVRASLRDSPIVAISGPRQSGKTTLARQFAQSSRQFVSLDNLTTLASAKADPIGFIANIGRAVIDEVQRAPELLLPIKQSIDEDRRPGRFLLTGSANIFTVPKIMESLAGRVDILELYPLARWEIEGKRRANFLQRAFTGNVLLNPPQTAARDLIDIITSGGYPPVLARKSPDRRAAWYRAYMRSLINRDIAEVATVDKLTRFPKLISVAATLSGTLLNLSDLARQVQLDYKTVDHYIAVLERLYIVHRLMPWYRNDLKRLVKTPKLHFVDSGLLAMARRVQPHALAQDRMRLGPLAETFVFSELLKLSAASDEPFSFFHYRDKDQTEVDIVVESANAEIVGVEVKSGHTVQAADFRGLTRLRDAGAEQFRLGVVLYGGGPTVSFGDRLVAAPMSSLWA